jgi:hypothetical protein
VEDPCNSSTWADVCDDAGSVGVLGFGVGHIVEPPILGLAALDGSRGDAEILRHALARVATAAAFDPLIAKASSALIAGAGSRLVSRDAQSSLSRTGVAVELGRRDVQQCRSDLEEALRLTTKAASSLSRDRSAALAPGRRAKAFCDAAAATLADAHAAASRFTIGLRRER